MNAEVYKLIGFFFNLAEYKIIGISSKSKEATLDDPIILLTEDLKKYMIKNTKAVKTSYRELNDTIMVVKDKQNVLFNYMKKRFQSAHF